MASPDGAGTTYGTTPAILTAVSKYLHSLARQLWRLFIGAQIFRLGSLRDGSVTPLLRFFASQPRWMLPYYRHIIAQSPLESFRALDRSLAWRRQHLLENPIQYHHSSEEEIRDAYLASGLQPSDLDL
ncbi:hypothetical protein PG994_001099 [Apiospora phragmitis]|uniref:Uncharacterized protein n=1 Tax=Apiospora phragmitis TaxID=2905665 RepID=A0ABR1WSI9_9PEZI